jgi:predicted glycoside hydrolase/deacetylase ChbG (UPF0249 family)
MLSIKSLGALAVFTLASSTLPAQARNLAQRLGYPANAKLVIIHADDLAVAHSVDVASFDALERGGVSSASIMMPTPWVTEVAAWAKAHPKADLGLHLTLTAEWETYKWGSVESKATVASLLDSTGVFPSDVPPVAARANPAEVERELRAQVERALAMGIHPTHLDSHMGTVFATPEMFAAYVKVAREYKLPFLAGRAAPLPVPATSSPNDVLVDALVMANESIPRDQWKQFYLDAIANLKPGLTYMIVHLGHDDAELQAVMVNHEPFGSAWRQRDYEVVTSPEFKKALADNHIVVVTWRALQQAMAK